MTWPLPEPMLTVGVDSPKLPAGCAAEPKWDGYRAQLAACAGGRVLLRSGQGTDMTASFPENRAAALSQLPTDIGLDGELVVWERDRLAFERLQQRLARRGSGAAEAARQWPAHYVIFDLVYAGADLPGWPYERRRAALEALFTDYGLEAPLALCPSTTDPFVAQGWLEWTAAGLEGLCLKRLDGPQVGALGWGGSTRCGSPPRPSSAPSPAPSRRPGRPWTGSRQPTPRSGRGRRQGRWRRPRVLSRSSAVSRRPCER